MFLSRGFGVARPILKTVFNLKVRVKREIPQTLKDGPFTEIVRIESVLGSQALL